jgi:hypothetical protein
MGQLKVSGHLSITNCTFVPATKEKGRCRSGDHAMVAPLSEICFNSILRLTDVHLLLCKHAVFKGRHSLNVHEEIQAAKFLESIKLSDTRTCLLAKNIRRGLIRSLLALMH